MPRDLLYKRAETEMRRRISSGDWPVGTRLGNEFQLADEFGVSQGTMRRALMTLEGDGLLARKPGRGTIVAAVEPPAERPAVGQLLTLDGGEAEFEIHRAKSAIRRADGDETALFGETELHSGERLLRFGGERAALEEVVIPVAAVAAFDEDGAVDLIEMLGSHGVTVARLEDTLSAQMTTMSESVALSCDRNTALLCVARVARDPAGQALARQVLKIAHPGIRYG